MPGALCSKSNRRRIVQIGGHPRIIKSAESLVWTDSFIRLFRRPTPYLGNVALYADVFYRDRRADLDIALLQDALAKAGVIKNDRQVIEIHARRFVNKEYPRTEFALEARN